MSSSKAVKLSSDIADCDVAQSTGEARRTRGRGCAAAAEAAVEDVDATPYCSVCLESLAKGESELPCAHQFHAECLALWLHKNDSCPCCRAQIYDPWRVKATPAGGCIQASGFTADHDLQIRASGFTSGAESQIHASGFTAGANTAILASGFTSNVADQSLPLLTWPLGTLTGSSTSGRGTDTRLRQGVASSSQSCQ
jgi:hypothetical protein